MGSITSAQAAARPVLVAGSANAVACVEPSTDDYNPGSGAFACDALQRLDGDWTGFGHLHAVGWVDPVTGNAVGRFVDDLQVTMADGSAGTVRLVGTLTVDGTTGDEKLVGRLMTGGGALRRARGVLRFAAFSPVTGGPALGSYEGHWSR